MSRIQIDLPADRTRLGELRLYTTDMDLICRFPCLGLADRTDASAHGNADRDPLRLYGNTPCGTYRASVATLPESPMKLRSYGPHPVIALDPIGGAALLAKQAGRRGLLVHGGEPASSGGLRPTHGCMRVSDATMAALHSAFGKHGTPTTVFIEEKENL